MELAMTPALKVAAPPASAPVLRKDRLLTVREPDPVSFRILCYLLGLVAQSHIRRTGQSGRHGAVIPLYVCCISPSRRHLLQARDCDGDLSDGDLDAGTCATELDGQILRDAC